MILGGRLYEEDSVSSNDIRNGRCIGCVQHGWRAELVRIFAAQYQLMLTEEVEIRYRTETSTDPEIGRASCRERV